MANPLYAVPLDQSGQTDLTHARRHRPVATPSFVQRIGAAEMDDREASEQITLLADALERIAATTTDESAREIAEEALALFQGQ